MNDTDTNIKKHVIMSVSLPPDLLSRIEAARRLGEGRSEFVRSAIEDYLQIRLAQEVNPRD